MDMLQHVTLSTDEYTKHVLQQFNDLLQDWHTKLIGKKDIQGLEDELATLASNVESLSRSLTGDMRVEFQSLGDTLRSLTTRLAEQNTQLTSTVQEHMQHSLATTQSLARGLAGRKQVEDLAVQLHASRPLWAEAFVEKAHLQDVAAQLLGKKPDWLESVGTRAQAQEMGKAIQELNARFERLEDDLRSVLMESMREFREEMRLLRKQTIAQRQAESRLAAAQYERLCAALERSNRPWYVKLFG